MLTQKQAERLLQPYLGPIHEVILNGFRSRQSRYAEELSKHTPRTRACLTNDLIIDAAKRRLGPLGIGVFKFAGRILFIIPNVAIIHFKKLDKHLLAQNYPTLFAIQWNSHEQLELPGIPATLPRLVAGFIPSKDWTGIAGTFVTLPNGNDIEWAIPLASSKPKLIPKQEDSQNGKTQRRKFRRKGSGPRPPDSATGTEGS